MKLACLAALAALALPGAAIAQQEVSPPATPPVTSANAGIAAQVGERQANVDATNAQIEQQDLAAYDQALRNQHRAIRDQRIYHRQQRAYADAMAAWRVQVADCHRGITAACNAPTPDPAAFF